MEQFLSNPGLQHLAENVFWNLDVNDLKICAQINQTCKQILKYPTFCLSKFEHLSEKNHRDWVKACQTEKNSDKGIAIISYFKWNLKKNILDPPCYSSPAVQDEFRKKICESCKKKQLSDEDTEIVKILAPLTDNPNAPDIFGDIPIIEAAANGLTEIVKILASLSDNPNAPDSLEILQLLRQHQQQMALQKLSKSWHI